MSNFADMSGVALTFDDVQILPCYSEIKNRDEVNVETQYTRKYRIRVPLIAAPMDTVCGVNMALSMAQLGGVGVLHRFLTTREQFENVKSVTLFAEAHGLADYPISAAIGVINDWEDRAEMLLKAGVKVLVLDVAHGHHVHVKRALEQLTRMKNEFEFDIVAGSIATHDAAEALEEWGADALRVGVGGGSVCETRIRTGIGLPQLQSVIETASSVSIPVISDGGIRYPGDAAKALAAGADSVMIGSLFAGTTEAPGEIFVAGTWPDDRSMKVYRGLASATTKLKYAGAASHVEGASKLVESRGPVSHIVKDIIDGITSSMSYVGAANLEEFRTKSRFIQVTPSGLAEAFPHGLK